MTDRDKTKGGSVKELENLRRRVAELEESEANLKTTERLLRESEKRFRLLYENAPLGYQSLDENGHFLEVNQAWLDSLGYSREEVIGKWVGEFLAPDYLDRLKENFSKFKAAGEIHGAEFVMLRKDGSRITVAVDGRIGHDKRGRFRQTHCILHDVTERKQMEQALTVREHEYRTLVENIPDLIVRYDTDLRRIYVNPAWEKASGLSAGDVINVRATDIPKVANPINVEYVEKLRQVLETGTPQAIEFTWVNTYGVTLFLEYVIVPEYDRNGKIASVLAVGHDLTERKRAEKALSEKSHFIDSLLRAAPIAIFYKDREGRYVGCNDAFTEIMGFSSDEIRGKTVHELWPSELADKYHQMDLELMRNREHQEYEFLVKAKDGETRPVIYAKDVYLDSRGEVAGLVGAFLDITERKLAEEALHRLNRELRAISICNQVLVRAVDEQTLLNEICRIICDEAGYRLAWVGYAENDDAKTIRPVAWAGFDSGYIADTKLSWADDTEHGRGPAGTVIRSGETIYVQDFTTDPLMAPWRESALQHGYRSGIALSLKDENTRVFGVLLIYHSEPNAITTEEVRLMEELAGDLAFGINGLRTRAERRKAEEALDRANQEWERTFRAISDGIMVLDNQHRILRANKSIADALGRMEQDLIGKFCFELVHGEKEPPVFCPHSQLLADGEVHSAEFPEPRLGGTYDVRVSPVLDQNDTVLGSVHVTRDITRRKNAEESLRKSEETLELALQGADLGLWDWYVRTGETTANQRAVEMAGYSLDEVNLSFDFWVSLLHLDDRPRSLERLFNHLEGLTDHYEDEYRVRHKSGDWKWILARGKITERDPDGKPLRVTGTFLDITDKKLAESQASEANELREKIVTESPMGIAVFRADGPCVSANEALGRIIGADEERILTQNFRTLASWKDSGLLADAEQVLSGGINNQREVHLTSTFGKSVWVNARMARLMTGGEPHLLIVLNDITERRTAEKALKFEREQLLSLFESINEVILVIDPQTNEILYANKFTEDLYGKELVGGVCYEKLNGFDAPCGHCFNEEIVKLRGQPYQWEYSNPALKRDFLATDRMIRWPDGRDVKFQIAIDITNRKEAEQEQEHLRAQLFQAQKMESIGTLAGGIAHDFNNLLQVILGYSDMMLFDKKPSDPDYEGLHAIRQAGMDGRDLANRILAFSRRLEPNVRPVNLNNEIRRVEKMLKRTLPKMIEIELRLVIGLMTVNADPGQIEQILLNLAVNAQHAMPDGGRLILETANVTLDEEYSRIHLDVEPGTYVLLTVSDTGQGMEEEVVGHIFEPFYTTKGPGEGTGLGLAMVFGIVKSHKGHISCYSEPGIGTTFKIYLPAIVREIEQEVAVTRQMPARGTETILLVDDEESIRKTGEQMLKTAGYSVLTAANGREALDVYRSNQDRIALVILDLIMPEMGGKQCLAELLKIDPRVKVLITSGFSANGPTQEAIEKGAGGFVSKPYDMRQILRAVRDVLDRD